MSDQEQLSTEQERAYVEAAWEWIVVRKRDDRPEWEWLGSLIWKMTPTLEDSYTSAWHAAFLFTKEHEGELKRRRYAISLLKLIYAQGGQGEWKPVDWKQDQEALEQVIAREQAALADLLRGRREKGDGK